MQKKLRYLGRRIGDIGGVEQYLGQWYNGKYIIYGSLGNLWVYKFNGSSFTLMSSYDSIGYDIWGDGTYIYVAAGTQGIKAFTCGRQGELTLKGSQDDGGTYVKLWGHGGYIYAANISEGIQAYSFDGSDFTLLDELDNGGTYWSLYGDDSYIYTAVGTDGIRAYSFDGSDLALEGSDDQGGTYYDVYCQNGYIFASNVDDLLAYTFDGDDFTLKDSDSDSNRVGGDGKYIYSAKTTLKAYEFENDTLTEFDERDDGDGSFYDILAGTSDGYIHVAGFYEIKAYKLREIFALSVAGAGKLRTTGTGTMKTASD